MNKYRKLIGNSVIFAIGNLGSKLMQFILVPIYSFALTTSQFGNADFITTLVSLFSPVICLDLIDGVFRFAMDKSYQREKVFSTGMFFTLTASFLLLTVCYLINRFIKNPFVLPGALLLIATVFYSIISNYVRAIGYVKVFAIAGIINTFAMAIFNILFLVIWKLGVRAYLNAYTLGQVIAILFLLAVTPVIYQLKWRNFDHKLLREMTRYSIPLIPNTFAWWLNSASDRFFILLMVGTSANGIYAMVNKFPTMITTVMNIFSQSWQMSAIEEFNSKDSKQFISNVLDYIISLLFFFSLGLLLILKPLMKLLLSSGYYGGWRLVPLMLIAVIYTTLASFLGVMYTADKKTSGIFYSTLIGAIINVICTVILIKLIGVYGATVANTISFACVSIYRYIEMKRIDKVQLRISKFILLHLIFGIATGIIFLTDSYPISFMGIGFCILLQVITDNNIRKLGVTFISKVRSCF